MTGSNVAFPVWAAIAVVAILAAVFLRARKKRQSK
jgi:LPXTG-motif cell wall-anchored protein